MKKYDYLCCKIFLVKQGFRTSISQGINKNYGRDEKVARELNFFYKIKIIMILI